MTTIIGAFLVTAVYGTEQMPRMQLELLLSGQQFLLQGVVAYVVAAAVALPVGFLLGARFPTAVTVAAVVLMAIGVLLTAFAAGGGMMTVGRVLTGLGAGAAAGVIGALARRIGRWGAVAAMVVVAFGLLSIVAAPFVSQMFSDAFGFRTTFFAAIPLLLAALLATAISALVSYALAPRPARPGPYGMPNPPQGPHR
ncbi:MFS transporter [Allonocardiopsis opalescens]|nr:MFS transporter [Allonocardiopsis opalescens]